MSGNKPTRMWHADKEGRCHRDCEAFSPGDDSFTGEPCDVLARLPWPRWHGVRVGDPCPFAVLGDVLCAVKTHEEKADEEHICVTCRYLKTILPMTCKMTGKTDGIEPDGPEFDCPLWRKP